MYVSFVYVSFVRYHITIGIGDPEAPVCAHWGTRRRSSRMIVEPLTTITASYGPSGVICNPLHLFISSFRHSWMNQSMNQFSIDRSPNKPDPPRPDDRGGELPNSSCWTSKSSDCQTHGENCHSLCRVPRVHFQRKASKTTMKTTTMKTTMKTTTKEIPRSLEYAAQSDCCTRRVSGNNRGSSKERSAARGPLPRTSRQHRWQRDRLDERGRHDARTGESTLGSMSSRVPLHRRRNPARAEAL